MPSVPANDASPDTAGVDVTIQPLAIVDIQREAVSSMRSTVHFVEAVVCVVFWGHQEPASLQRAERDALTAISSTISPKLPTIPGTPPDYTSSPAEAFTLLVRPDILTTELIWSFAISTSTDSIPVATAASKPGISYTSQRAELPQALAAMRFTGESKLCMCLLGSLTSPTICTSQHLSCHKF